MTTDNIEWLDDNTQQTLSSKARAFSLSENPGVLEQTLGGMKHAWDRAAYGLSSLFGDKSLKELTDQGSAFVKETGPASTVGEVLGDVLMTAPVGGAGATGAKAAARFLPRATGAAPVVGDIAAQTGFGALTAAPEQREQGALAAGTGAALGNLILGRVAKGLPGISPEARALMDTTEIQPTAGMAIPHLRAVEEFSQRVPIIGEFTKNARSRALNEFSADAITQAVPFLKNTGAQLKGSTAQMLDQAHDIVSGKYDQLVPYMRPTMSQLESMVTAYDDVLAKPYLSDLERKSLSRVFEPFKSSYKEYQAILRDPLKTAEEKALAGETVLARSPFGRYTGVDIKQFDSELGAQTRKYLRSPTSSDLGEAFSQIQQGLRKGIEDSLPADLRGIHAETNVGYRNLLALDKAASATAEGRITPFQLTKAIAARDKVPSVRTKGPLAEYARNAQTILPEANPNAHLSGAGLTSAALASGAGYLTGNLPGLLASVLLTGVGSTRPAQKALLGNTAMQRALREFNQRAPMHGAVGAALNKSDTEE